MPIDRTEHHKIYEQGRTAAFFDQAIVVSPYIHDEERFAIWLEGYRSVLRRSDQNPSCAMAGRGASASDKLTVSYRPRCFDHTWKRHIRAGPPPGLALSSLEDRVGCCNERLSVA